jgi:hypothetical protein
VSFKHIVNARSGIAVIQEVNKGVWGMPRLSEAKKDVINCDKPRELVIRANPRMSEWVNPLR